jgi:hypothetical protein
MQDTARRWITCMTVSGLLLLKTIGSSIEDVAARLKAIA